MRHLRQVGAVLTLMVLVSSAAAAQRTTTRASSQAPAQVGGFWELGADAGISLRVNDPLTVQINIPVSSVRLGYYASNILSIEPLLSINSRFGKDQTGQTAYTFGVGVLYHLTPDRTKQQTYLRPFLAIRSTSGPNSVTFTSLGFGAGIKKPMFNGRLASRMEANLQHQLETGAFPAITSVNALLGFSVYSR